MDHGEHGLAQDGHVDPERPAPHVLEAEPDLFWADEAIVCGVRIALSAEDFAFVTKSDRRVVRDPRTDAQQRAFPGPVERRRKLAPGPAAARRAMRPGPASEGLLEEI